MGNPRWTQTTVPRYLPDRIAQIYYAHGLFCSSHPILAISFTVTVILLFCYTLINVPFFDNTPIYFSDSSTPNVNNIPIKTNSVPKLYIQQIIMKSSVSPWTNDLILTDAFRAPLAESFKLLEIIHNFQYDNSSLSVDNFCLHVENLKQNSKKASSLLPEYNCLILSPSNLWSQDYNKFQLDTNLINTIYNQQNVAKGKVTVAEMLFGIPLKDSGIKRYSIRSKQRIIKYAITIFMTEHNKSYIKGLDEYLQSLYPIQKVANIPNSINESFYICYPKDRDYGALIPLSITYAVVFLYVYYLVTKMEYIRSKIGVAIGAVLTVLGSFLMTCGICLFFGLEINGGKSQYKQIFPYLVIIFGIENVFVLMKSVVSTLPHLDAKIRVAQGLSKEGWNITKNLLIELTILTAGLLTFVPAIQEFCIFAIVGVLSDFFLQSIFFSTILSIYIRCTEHCTYPQYSYYSLSSAGVPSRYRGYYNNYNSHLANSCNGRLPRSRSQPKLSSQNVIATWNNNSNVANTSLPKRVKVINFWARTRIVQRCFMIGMVGWIAAIAYNGGTLHTFIGSYMHENDESGTNINKRQKTAPVSWNNTNRISLLELESKILQATKNSKMELGDNRDNSSDHLWLKSVDYDVRQRLSPHHWSSILAFYNLSLSSSCITILPPIHIAHEINPETAQALRNPNEKGVPFRWTSLAIALDPLDFTDLESTVKSTILNDDHNTEPLLPTSPMQIAMMAVLCTTSILVLMYTVYVLYKCICSRNYAEWRTSWTSSGLEDTSIYTTQVILEAVPISIQGHSHQIECISSDGNVIVSTCLAGQIKVWDAVSGAFIQEIDRRKFLSNTCANENKPKLVSHGSKELYLTSLLPEVGGHCNSFDGENRSSSTFHCINSSNVINSNPARQINHFNIEHLSPNHVQRTSTPPTSSLTFENKQSIPRPDSGRFLNRTSNSSPDFNSKHENESDFINAAPIWCLDCKDNLIVLGYMNGLLEFWECTTGILKCVHDDQDNSGITTVKLVGRTVIAGKLNGYLGFYTLDIVPSKQPLVPSYSPYTKHRRGHTRSGSMGSITSLKNIDSIDEVQCVRIELNKAHSKTITILEVENGKTITGSQDHTLKVFNLEDQRLLYNLIGHHGPITCIFIDRIIPSISATGSQDGLLCVWDLQTGTCMYNIQAHDGAVCALTYSASYIISLGLDERLCIWDRFQGHLLNTIPLTQSYCTSLSMLTHSLLIASKQGCLMVIDVTTGEIVRAIKLGHCDTAVFIKHIINLGDGVVCDYGEQLKLIKFPLVCDKSE